ncbi:hypothetical protein VTN31DRAFT_1912 [Thermomyces dupontii]|uniref:uncharacterized protein n=1 Tax=Talaromyces thermophilus TaxID=28565 RepID=UPI00374466D3
MNLVSPGQLVRAGYTFCQVTIGDQHSILLESPDGTSVHMADLTPDDIYVFRPVRPHNVLYFALPGRKDSDFHPEHAPSVSQEMDDRLVALPAGKQRPIMGDTIMGWHRRLGHLNEQDIKRLAFDPRLRMHITGVQVLPSCETCIQGKMTRKVFF